MESYSTLITPRITIPNKLDLLHRQNTILLPKINLTTTHGRFYIKLILCTFRPHWYSPYKLARASTSHYGTKTIKTLHYNRRLDKISRYSMMEHIDYSHL